jgi:hypothetical protein
MEHHPYYVRPTLDEALAAFKALLQQRSLPTEILWVFDENLVFERDSSTTDGFRLGFQTRFSPAPAEAERIAYKHFLTYDCRLVFYRIGSQAGKSVCLLLCDKWFDRKSETDGFVKRDEWLISFRPGPANELELITDEARWAKRILRGRPLHDLDFCMTLRAVHEILAHGRVLTPYERYALKLMHVWRRILGH